jgi:hypothetical protein
MTFGAHFFAAMEAFESMGSEVEAGSRFAQARLAR